jgi:hypothetical protein
MHSNFEPQTAKESNKCYFEFSINEQLKPGQHTLVIERSNSPQWEEPDWVDKDGPGFISEQCLDLDSIWYEDVTLPHKFLIHGKFFLSDINGVEISIQNTKWRPNGRWEWTFHAPVLDWIINNVRPKQQIHDLLNDSAAD